MSNETETKNIDPYQQLVENLMRTVIGQPTKMALLALREVEIEIHNETINRIITQQGDK